MKTRLSLIAAIDRNRLMANSGGIPWRLRTDVAHFRNYTRGKWLLLGRRTFEEMRGWFDQSHTPLVLSSQCGWDPPIGRVVASVPQALALADSAGQDELVCVGGGQAFAASLPFADKLVITFVDCRTPPDEGAVYFPKWNETEWIAESEKSHPADSKNAHPFGIVEFVRK